MSSTGSKGSGTAALLLRLTLGPMLMAHGHNKVWGGGGLEGTARYFESLGLKPGSLHARLAAATELGAGALLTAGAGSPLPAAATIGLMATAARTDHKGKGLFIFKGGWEYTAVVAGAAAASAALGSGPLSVDRARGRGCGGPGRLLLAVLLGVAGAAGILSRVHPEPPSDQTPD